MDSRYSMVHLSVQTRANLHSLFMEGEASPEQTVVKTTSTTQNSTNTDVLTPSKATLILNNLFVLRFYGPVNPMGSCRARSVYLTTRLLGRLSPLSA